MLSRWFEEVKHLFYTAFLSEKALFLSMYQSMPQRKDIVLFFFICVDFANKDRDFLRNLGRQPTQEMSDQEQSTQKSQLSV